MDENDRTHFVDGDWTEPAVLPADPRIAGVLDLSRPLAVIQDRPSIR